MAEARQQIDAAAASVRLFNTYMEIYNARVRAEAVRFGLTTAALMNVVDVQAFVDDATKETREYRAKILAEEPFNADDLLREPDPDQPDTLGWRAWKWDAKLKRLVSPHYKATWETAQMRSAKWDNDEAVRGVSGLHARRMPMDWRHAGWPYGGHQEGPEATEGVIVTGVVERFGRYVLGTKGWRAEIVSILELQCPDVATYLAVSAAYPQVKVHIQGV